MTQFPEMAQLRLEYLAGAAHRLELLTALHPRLVSFDRAAVTEVRQIVHKLRGSAGFYGFPALSQAAAILEDHLVAALDGEASYSPPGAQAHLQVLLLAIQTEIDRAGPLPPKDPRDV